MVGWCQGLFPLPLPSLPASRQPMPPPILSRAVKPIKNTSLFTGYPGLPQDTVLETKTKALRLACKIPP